MSAANLEGKVKLRILSGTRPAERNDHMLRQSKSVQETVAKPCFCQTKSISTTLNFEVNKGSRHSSHQSIFRNANLSETYLRTFRCTDYNRGWGFPCVQNPTCNVCALYIFRESRSSTTSQTRSRPH